MVLRHRDLELLRFDWTDLGGVCVTSVNESARRFLPLDFKGQPDDRLLFKWISHRTVPRGRAHIRDMLLKLGLNPDDLQSIIAISHGLSLNDVYWIVNDSFSGKWADFNLYEHDFSKAISYMAFTGGGSQIRQEWTSSPEFTTNGLLAKCWRRVKGDVVLYKTGTEGAVNAGFEPYSEYYASQVAEALGLSHVQYGLSKFKGRICSTCSLFTSERIGFIPAGRLMNAQQALQETCFSDVFFFDSIVFNTDRHLGNFGYLIDNDSNTIIGTAPIFDNGYGLFSQAVYSAEPKFDEFADLRKFLRRVHPSLYLNWLKIPGGLTEKRINQLKALRGFRFTQHPNYNLPTKRLRLIEDFLQKRVLQIIEFGEKADDFIKVLNSDDNVNGKFGCECEHDRHSVDEKILANMRADAFVSYEELASLVGLSKSTVVRHVARLKAEGVVRRAGSDKAGYWAV